MKLRLFMVDANGWSTLKDPAYYDIYTGDGERYRFNAFKTSPQYMQLVSHRSVTGREETYQDMGVEVIRDASQNLRQVLLPSRLADIVVMDGCHYAVKFYTLAAMEGGKDTNGCYRIAANAVPFETWSFANPEPGTLRKLRVTRTMGARTTVYDYTYEAAADTWTMATGAGNSVARLEEEETRWNDARTERLITSTIKATDGSVVSRSLERVKTFSWGDGVTVRVTDPGGANLTNSFAYNAAGLTDTAIEPDGSWRWYGYDATGRVTNELSAVKDSALTPVPSAAHSVETSYVPVDANDSPRLNDQLPRSITESVLGKVVSRTYRAYRQGGNGELQEIVEKATTPAAVYGDASNLRTVTTYYGTNTANCQIGRVATVAYPDGRQDTFTYEYGTYQPAIGEIPPSFTPNSSSNYWCETVVHGTVNEPYGIADKTTKETRILDPMSQEVLSETWVCQGGPNYERVAWVAKTFDDWQHPILTLKSNGERTEASWGENCCGKEWELGPDGVMYAYGYDSLGRMMTSVKRGATSNDTDLATSFTYDATGHRLTETLAGGGLSQLVSSNTYDLAGRLVSTMDGQGIITTYSYAGPANTTIRGGLTNTTVHYLSGQSKATLENGVIKTAHDYGVSTNGTQWSKAFTGPAGTNSPMWSKTSTDLLGRTIKDEKPGYGGTVVSTTYSYNTKGQLTSTTQQPNNSTTLNEYNELGQQIRSGLDLNTNGVLDLAGPDRITEPATWYEQDASNDYWQCRASLVYAGDNSATPTTNSIQKSRVTGLGGSSGFGILASEFSSFDLLGNPTVSRTYTDRAAKTVRQAVTYPDSTNVVVQTTVNGLLVASISKTGVETPYAYDALGRQSAVRGPRSATYTYYNALGQVVSTMDGASNVTRYAYDELGRRIAVTDALSKTTYTAYDAEGRVLATWGATYPVAYEYDVYGRITAMYTYRGTNAIASYSEISNLKSQMDRTAWLYDQATGLLTNKLYADGKGTAYSYTPDGKLLTRTWARGVVTTYSYDPLGQLSSVSYSDNTPGVSFGYERLGRQTTITDGTGTRTFTYNDALQLAAETNALDVIARTYDSHGRPAGLSIPDYSVTYGYDPLGRFASVSSTVMSVSSATTYNYLPGADLLAGYDLTSGTNVLAVRKTYEANRALLATVSNMWNGAAVSPFEYLNDALARRVRRVDTAGVTNDFDYNLRSELVNAMIGTNHYGYAYDPIGNRRVATNNAEVLAYLANALNQYTNISDGAVIAPGYDADGNMTNYGAFAFLWDGENRLVGVSTNGQAVAYYAYDYMSRRYQKVVGGVTNTFLYDGWAMIRESVTRDSSLVTNSYVYGLDLSGTLQGAGTIGGILGMNLKGTNAFCVYEANGNLTDLVGTDGGAHYEYDPYGNTIAQSGALADANSFRFSSKYTDSETGLVYFGYRFVAPIMGRWMSRDPITEKGGKNIYAFCKNSPIIRSDSLGLSFNVEHQTGWSRLDGREGWTIPDGPAWISMAVNLDSKCPSPRCYRLIYRDDYMKVVRWLWILAEDWVEAHEDLHVQDFRNLAYDQAVAYGRNYAGGCYTRDAAFCWWSAVRAAAQKYYWQAGYTTLFRHDNMNDPRTAADYASYFNSYNNASEVLRLLEDSCRGL